MRIARTAREMGIEPVGVFASNDADAFHARVMARSVDLGSGAPAETYLSIPRLLAAAAESGADAVHPGYGFLSENPAFARAVTDAGLLWIGPPAEAIEKMGDKLEARRRMREAGVPVVPGSDAVAGAEGSLAARAAELGFPLLVKAAAGGGGKGMARVDSAEELAAAIDQTARVAEAAFSDGRVYVEKYFDRPRHVEFQIFADRVGSVVHLFERECSVQRRHQKVIEETPSSALDSRLRESMGRAAVEAARAVGYVGAGTVEFLLDERRNFYFLEMNTRLQVEHPITEETLGVDLVRAQFDIAAGAPLPSAWRGGKLSPQGHAIELRLYAESPVDFLPRSGKILVWEEPGGPGVRVDSGVEAGSRVGIEFDPLLAKLGRSPRRTAQRRSSAPSEPSGNGSSSEVETNAPLLRSVLESSDFRSGRYSTALRSRAFRGRAFPSRRTPRGSPPPSSSRAPPVRPGSGSSRASGPLGRPRRLEGRRVKITSGARTAEVSAEGAHASIDGSELAFRAIRSDGAGDVEAVEYRGRLRRRSHRARRRSRFRVVRRPRVRVPARGGGRQKDRWGRRRTRARIAHARARPKGARRRRGDRHSRPGPPDPRSDEDGTFDPISARWARRADRVRRRGSGRRRRRARRSRIIRVDVADAERAGYPPRMESWEDLAIQRPRLPPRVTVSRSARATASRTRRPRFRRT